MGNETSTVLPSKGLQLRESNKQKTVIRGHASAELRIPMHRVPWEHRGKTSRGSGKASWRR